MYPNITLDHGIRAVRHKLLDRDSESLSAECIIDAIKLLERVPIYSLKVDIIFPSKVATEVQSMHVPTLRWMKSTNF